MDPRPTFSPLGPIGPSGPGNPGTPGCPVRPGKPRSPCAQWHRSNHHFTQNQVMIWHKKYLLMGHLCVVPLLCTVHHVWGPCRHFSDLGSFDSTAIAFGSHTSVASLSGDKITKIKTSLMSDIHSDQDYISNQLLWQLGDVSGCSWVSPQEGAASSHCCCATAAFLQVLSDHEEQGQLEPNNKLNPSTQLWIKNKTLGQKKVVVSRKYQSHGEKVVVR